MNPIDIFITTYQRQNITNKTLEYLFERTDYPFRLFIINNGESDEVLEKWKAKIFLRVDVNPNGGIHNAWNLALAMAESEYFITSDNDIWVPDLRYKFFAIAPGALEFSVMDSNSKRPCWLERIVEFIQVRPDYGAISLCPHAFIGAEGIDPYITKQVLERNMCGAVMRIMRRESVWKAGGWDKVIRTGRNHEERTICSRLQSIGLRTGIATRIRAFHPFPENWGYDKEFTPEMQGHNPALKDYVTSFGNIDQYDHNTWLPK